MKKTLWLAHAMGGRTFALARASKTTASPMLATTTDEIERMALNPSTAALVEFRTSYQVLTRYFAIVR